MAESSGLAASELQRRAAGGALWSSMGATLLLPLSIVVSVVVARGLGPDAFARFALLAFLVPLLHAVADLGFAQALTREASAAYAAGRLEETRELLGKALGWNVLRLPLVLVVTVVVARPSLFALGAIVALLFSISAASGLNFALNAANRTAPLAKAAFVQGLVSAASTMTAVALGAAPATVWAVGLSAGLVAVPGWLWATPRELRRAALRPRLPTGLGRGFWRYGIGCLAASLGALLVFSRSEIVVLHLFHQEHALAVFALAYGMSQRLTTPVDTLLGPLIPALTGLASAHPERLQAGVSRALRVASAAVSLLAGGAVVGTALAAPLLFGDAYRGVGPTFSVLALVSLLQSAAQPYSALAYAVGRPAVVLRAAGAALALDVAAAVALVPLIGVWGAVVANVVGGVAAAVLTARGVSGAGSLARAGVRRAALVACAAAGAGAAGACGLVVTTFSPAFGAIAAFAAGGVVALSMARSLSVLDDADLDALVAALPALLAWVARLRLSGRGRGAVNGAEQLVPPLEREAALEVALRLRGESPA